MKSGSAWILAAVLSTLMLAACKKPPTVPPPAVPDPKAESSASDPNSPGTTTNFESGSPSAK